MGQDTPEPPSPHPTQKHGRTLVLRLLRDETVEALLARLRLLRGLLCSMENLGEKEKGAVSLHSWRLRAELGQGSKVRGG